MASIRASARPRLVSRMRPASPQVASPAVGNTCSIMPPCCPNTCSLSTMSTTSNWCLPPANLAARVRFTRRQWIRARGGTAMAEQLTTRQRRILEVIRDAVADRGYPPSIREIGEAVGLTSTSSVHSQLEALQRKGFIRRDPTKPRAIEVHLEEPAAAMPRPLPTYVPLMSAPVAAGTGTLPEDVVEELLPLPRELVGQGQLFMLQVRGESMVGAGVLDRDYVVVRRQDSADNGDMVAALLPNDESEATVKHFSRRGGHVQLLPDNPAFDPIDGDNAQILGKVVAVLRRLR